MVGLVAECNNTVTLPPDVAAQLGRSVGKIGHRWAWALVPVLAADTSAVKAASGELTAPSDCHRIQCLKALAVELRRNCDFCATLLGIGLAAIGAWFVHEAVVSGVDSQGEVDNTAVRAELWSSLFFGAVLSATSVVMNDGGVRAVARAACSGASRGGLAAIGFVGLKAVYGNSWTLNRVIATALAGAVARVLNGGKPSDGFIKSFAISLLTHLNYVMRQSMIAQSSLNPDNIGKASSGFFGDKIAIAGTRRIRDPRYGFPWVEWFTGKKKYLPCGGPAGGCQGIANKLIGDQPSRVGPFIYSAGDWFDKLCESFAGPHDWLSDQVGMYDRETGNGVFRTGLSHLVYWIASYALIPASAPFAAAGLIDTVPTAHQALYQVDAVVANLARGSSPDGA